MSRFPGYCCQRCGAPVGYLGRLSSAIFGPIRSHGCIPVDDVQVGYILRRREDRRRLVENAERAMLSMKRTPARGMEARQGGDPQGLHGEATTARSVRTRPEQGSEGPKG